MIFFENNKLYGIYNVISKKTIRKDEKYFKKFRGYKSVPGNMVKTNRGYFIDGYNVDPKSANIWFESVKLNRKIKNEHSQ